MSEILLRHEEARQHADVVRNRAMETEADFETMKQRLLPLAESFRGRSADAFNGKIEEWQVAAKSLLEALEGLGHFLNGAADAIEQTDTDLASQLSAR